MRKIIIINLIVITLFSIKFTSTVSAHGEEDFDKAEEIIKSNIPCDQLAEDQLELIGDYYMEQMHPGEAHEAMDEMMGGEGSESLREMHIAMARSFYCGDHDAMSSSIMDRMMGRGAVGVGLGGGMMNTNWPFGFMGGFGWIFMILFWVAVVLLIVWLIRQLAQKK